MFLVWLRLSAAWACGPYFPVTILDQPAESLWSAPVSDFATDIQDLYGGEPLGDPWSQTVSNRDVEDLKAVLGAGHPAVEAVEQLRGKTHGWRKAPVFESDIPDDLPAEFDRYLRGAVAFHSGDVPTARQHWAALMALPTDQRPHRTTWAAFMLGRTAASDAERDDWFAQVRALADSGFEDSLGLAAATYGYEARERLMRGAQAEAADLYIKQARGGSRSGVLSLRIVARDALMSDDLSTVAADEDLRQLVTAWLIAHNSDHPRAGAWLAAVEGKGAAVTSGADRMAWLSYQAGDMDAAARWLARSPQTGLSRWIDARLKMRAGDIAAAEKLLAEAAAELDVVWPRSGWPSRQPELLAEQVVARHEALAERGALLVQQERYTEALDAFIDADHWLDAAYIAERILTANELKNHVDATYPEADALAADEAANAIREYALDTESGPRIQLRALLGRRLMREERPDEAIAYLLPDDREHGTAYARALAAAKASDTEQLARAEAWWTAAKLARFQGMEILATELGPDFAYVNGSYEAPALVTYRLEHLEGSLTPTADERARAARNAPLDKRFHYRHTGADHAWRAATLLPDDDDLTVKILCQAGTWLRYEDPEAADRYYKAMVTRGWNNPISQRADRNRWFPTRYDACDFDDFAVTHPLPKPPNSCAAVASPAAGWLGVLGAMLLGWRRRR